MDNEKTTTRRGRPARTTPRTKGVMVRITFRNDDDRERVMDYLAEVAQGRPLGRTIRDIIDAARVRGERL